MTGEPGPGLILIKTVMPDGPWEYGYYSQSQVTRCQNLGECKIQTESFYQLLATKKGSI